LGFNKTDQQLFQFNNKMSELTRRVACTVNLYPNPTAPLIPLYPNLPVGENRSRNLTSLRPASCAALSAASAATAAFAFAAVAAPAAVLSADNETTPEIKPEPKPEPPKAEAPFAAAAAWLPISTRAPTEPAPLRCKKIANRDIRVWHGATEKKTLE
jgi:hypothetical protein